VLEGVSVSLPAGQTLVVFGPNGSGKTTLLRVLAGLLRPRCGRVRVLGADLPRQTWALRGRIGWLGHDPLLYSQLSARENLTYHARLHGSPRGRVDEVLDAVGMSARADDPVRELSRGMVQRVATARAVLAGPELLLLDEPLTNLDPGARERVWPLLATGPGHSRVMTSHDPATGLAEADIVLGLRNGRPELCGTADSVSADDVMELYR
jgi:heme exporter protein A